MNEYELYNSAIAITSARDQQLDRDYLKHHGILGMKWGIRRYQNDDGSLTELGQRHYDMLERKQELDYDRKNRKEEADVERQRLKYQRATEKQGLYNQRDRDVYDFANQERERKIHRRNVVTAVAVGALAVGGGIALHQYLKNKGNTPIDSPELKDTITKGSKNIKDMFKPPLTFGSNGGIKLSTDKYDLSEKGLLANLKVDEIKKNYKLAKRDKWEADNGTISDITNAMTKRRRAQLERNTAADLLSKQRTFERRKNLMNQVFEPGVRADKKGEINWGKIAYKQGMKLPTTYDETVKQAVEYLDKVHGTSSSKSSGMPSPSDLIAAKAVYDTAINNLGSNLDKASKKFKHSESGDIMDENTIMHTAMAIHKRRNEQLEHKDEYLTHSGRKGMKWGENIYAQDPANNRQISGQSQYAQQLQAEAMKRKYGGIEQHYDTGRGAQIREQQRKQREAQAKYGGGNAVKSEVGNGAKIREEQRKRREATINVGGKQVSTSDVEKYKNMYGNTSSDYANKKMAEAANKVSNIPSTETKTKVARVDAVGSVVGNKAYQTNLKRKMYTDPDLMSVDSNYSAIDDITSSDEYKKLFSDKPRGDKDEQFKHEQAREEYIKANLRKRGHSLIDEKYNNGDYDTEIEVNGVKTKVHPSEDDIKTLKDAYDKQVGNAYAQYELSKRHLNGFRMLDSNGMNTSIYEDVLDSDNESMYDSMLKLNSRAQTVNRQKHQKTKRDQIDERHDKSSNRENIDAGAGSIEKPYVQKAKEDFTENHAAGRKAIADDYKKVEPHIEDNVHKDVSLVSDVVKHKPKSLEDIIIEKAVKKASEKHETVKSDNRRLDNADRDSSERMRRKLKMQ